MFRILFSVLFSCSLLFSSSEKESEAVQIIAENLDTNNTAITATGNVVLFSQSYYITAGKLVYDSSKETIELFDDVNIIKNGKSQSITNYAFLDLNNNNDFMNPVLMLNYADEIWVNSLFVDKQDEQYNFKSSTLSSCDCKDPAWSIRFSSGSHDKKEQWLHTYNARLYIRSVPVFYTPYFGFSTDKTRRTGLLRPTIGYSKTEGFLYAQPIYFAPKANWDIELIPQYRAKRGEGIYGYYRYADSPFSKLDIKTGHFTETNNYYKIYDLKNNKHVGWDIDYKRNKLFSNNQTQDGLIISLHWLNDIDYKNLEQIDERNTYNKNIESKINYFYNATRFYAGTYFRYYLDSSKENNDDTLQQLPALHLHSFSNPLLLDNLMYSIDLQYTNFTRQEGLGANRYDLFLPIYYNLSLFNDYLKLTFKEEIVSTKIMYSNSQNMYSDASFFQNKHIISLGTDLLKPYDNYIHTLNFNADMTIPDTSNKEGDIYKLTNDSSDLSPFPQTQVKKNIAFSLNHSLYDKSSTKQVINHKIKQSILYNESSGSNLSNLENELTYNHGLGSISNRLLYSHMDKEIIESSSLFNVAKNGNFLKLNHYSSKNTPNSNKSDSESYTATIGAKVAKFYTLSYLENYNIKDRVSNKKEYKLNIRKKCWSLDIKLEDSLVAASTSDGSALRQNIVYLNLELRPIGGIKQKYKQNARKE